MASRVLLDVGSGLVGKLIIAALGFVLSPYFFRWLGPEAYGLVGFYNALLGLLMLLDLGFATVVGREVAGRAGQRDAREQQELRDLFATFSGLYWGVGAVLGALCWVLAPVMVERWLNLEKIPLDVAVQAVRVMALSVVLAWPQSVYTAFLQNLGRQVLLNSVSLLSSLMRSLLGLALMLWITRDVRVYFGLQLLLAALTVAMMYAGCRGLIQGEGGRGVFRRDLLSGHGSFALSSAVITLSSTVLNQLDRLAVAKLLPLGVVGFYALATTLGMTMYYFSTPIYSAYAPRLAQRVAEGDEAGLREQYHGATQLAAVLLGSPCAVLCVFSGDLLLVWTKNPQVPEVIGGAVPLLVAATAIHGVMHIPYALMVAHKWTGLSAWINAVSLLVMIPGQWWLTRTLGPTGAALGWLIVQGANFLITVPVVHRRFLAGDQLRWLLRSLLLPAAAAFAVAAAARMAVTLSTSRAGALLELGAIGLLALGASLAAAPHAREVLGGRLRRAG